MTEHLHSSTDPVDPTGRDQQVRPRGRRWWGLVLIGAGGLVLLWAGWVTFRVWQAADHLADARAEVGQLRPLLDDPTAVDLAAVEERLARLQDSTAGATSAADDPLVRALRWLPLIGDDLTAVGEVSAATDSIATEVLPRLVDVGRVDLAALLTRDGRIDLAPLLEVAPELIAADDATTAIAAKVAAIDRSSLLSPIADGVGALQAQLVELSDVTATGAGMGRVVEGLFADGEPRSVLVMIQNPAEPRATGGIPGSSILLHLEGGSLTLADQDPTSRTLEPFDPPLVDPTADLPPELYGGLPLVYPTDTTMTPDFPTAAALFQRMYSERTGTEVDAVLGVDPIVVSRMLEGTPPIQVPGHDPVDSADLAEFLLSTVYREFDTPADAPARDAVLAQVTGLAFTEVLRQDPQVLLNQVRRGIDDHRFQLWFADADLQQVIQETDLSGAFPRAVDEFGVFRNDGTGGKLGWYSDGEVAVTAATACTDGRRPFTVTTVLEYAPADSLPEYVLGHAKAGPGILRTNVLVFAPAGAEWDDVLVDGAPAPSVRTFQGGRPVVMVTVDQAVGAVELTVSGSTDGRALAGSLRVTPGIGEWSTSRSPIPSC